MSVTIFCDAGRDVGFGHVMRCASLANAYLAAGNAIRVLVPAGGLTSVPQFLRDSMPISELDESDIDPCRLAIVDSYRLPRDTDFHAERVLAFDDQIGPPREADYLLNAGADDCDYPATRSRLLTGPRHAPVVDSFLAKRPLSLSRRSGGNPCRHVFVSLGGSADGLLINRVLDALRNFEVSIDVAVGSSAPNLDAVMARRDGRTMVHVDSPDMATLMANADLAVGAGGSTSWERCVLGLPTVVLELALNQRGIIGSLVRAGAALDAGQPGTDLGPRLAGCLSALVDHPNTLWGMGQKAAALCDGRGAKRVVVATAGRGGTELRMTELDEVDWVLEQAQNAKIPVFGNDSPAAALLDKGLTFVTILRDGIPVGVARLRKIAERRYSTVLLVASQFRGRGVGKAAIGLLKRCVPGSILELDVPGVPSESRKALRCLGFQETEQGKMECIST